MNKRVYACYDKRIYKSVCAEQGVAPTKGAVDDLDFRFLSEEQESGVQSLDVRVVTDTPIERGGAGNTHDPSDFRIVYLNSTILFSYIYLNGI